MRKPLLLLLIAFYFCKASFAQISSNAFKRFGLKAGVNVSNMNFNKGFPPPPVPIKAKWKAGTIISFLLYVPLYSNLLIQPEYSFTQVLGEDKSTGISYRLNYLSMPVLLKYQIAPKLAIEAGPQVDL